MLDKEIKKNKALFAILGKSEVKDTQVKGVSQEPKAAPKKPRNERAYARYRGKAEDGETKTKAMSYYISDSHIKAISVRLEKGLEKDKSAVVRAAIEQYLKVELKEISKVGR